MFRLLFVWTVALSIVCLFGCVDSQCNYQWLCNDNACRQGYALQFGVCYNANISIFTAGQFDYDNSITAYAGGVHTYKASSCGGNIDWTFSLSQECCACYAAPLSGIVVIQIQGTVIGAHFQGPEPGAICPGMINNFPKSDYIQHENPDRFENEIAVNGDSKRVEQIPKLQTRRS